MLQLFTREQVDPGNASGVHDGFTEISWEVRQRHPRPTTWRATCKLETDMGIKRFEDLRVWQEAKQLADDIGRLLRRGAFQRDPRLRDQLSGASCSTVLNIAEGFLRRSSRELARYLRIAAAENGEVRAALHLALGRAYITTEEHQRTVERSDAVGRMLRRFEQSLSTSPAPGNAPISSKSTSDKPTE